MRSGIALPFVRCRRLSPLSLIYMQLVRHKTPFHVFSRSFFYPCSLNADFLRLFELTRLLVFLRDGYSSLI